MAPNRTSRREWRPPSRGCGAGEPTGKSKDPALTPALYRLAYYFPHSGGGGHFAAAGPHGGVRMAAAPEGA
jgi:hypothetical protein